MSLLKKNNDKYLENRIKELEGEIEKIKVTSKGDTSFNIKLLAEIEELDIFSYNSKNEKFEFLIPNSRLFVIQKIPDGLDDFTSIIHAEDISTFQSALGKLPEKPYITCHLRIYLENDGSKELHSIKLNLVSKNDGFYMIIEDISHLAKQKKELERSKEKVEESDKLKSLILSNISHQIRTPLNSITGFSELLAHADCDNAKRKEYIEIIKRQSKRILNLIDDISEIARIGTGNINITKIPCNLNLILNELYIGINQQRAEKRKEQVTISLKTPDKTGLEIYTDSGRLQQTISNILNYSLRYTKQGSIEFGYTFDEVSQKLDFFVTDTSDGLSKDEQKVIFNKFSVIENLDSTKFEDPVLGLTIARSIVKTLGGKIWVESEEGKGNSFFFNIPYEPVPEKHEELILEEIHLNQSYEWPNKVILIVDDEEVNAMFLDAVFHGTSAQVLFAKNGQQAVELCKNISKIDLILMDLKMPVMNGIKATQEIRKFNTRIPIIAQTALASEEDRQVCLQVGCNDAITKPIEVEELLYLVNKYISD